MMRIRTTSLPFALCLAITFSAGFASAAVCPPGASLLASGVPSNVGADPVAVVAGDFNHDGKLDYVVAISHLNSGVQNGQIRVMLGNGDGTFTQGQLAPAGVCPLGIAVGDYNHDGIADLAVTNYGTSNVSVLLGNGSGGFGDGTFGPPTLYSCGASPHQIATADFNGDGILDLATANNGSFAKSVSVLIGKGTGGAGNGQFNTNVDYSLSAQTLGIIARDWDMDGKADIIATESTSGTVAFLKGKGDGTFFPAVHLNAGIEPYGVDIADLNADGFPDLIVSNSNSGGIAVLLNNGTGGVLSSVIYPTGNTGAAHAADMNGDGKPDLVYSTSISPVMGVLTNNGSGAFTPASTVSSGGFSVYFALADFDNDGKADAATMLYTSGVVSYFKGGCFTTPSDPNLPRITHVQDVPNDQGGKLFLTWTRSALDVTGGAVNAYRVWRRILLSPQAMAARMTRDAGSYRTTQEICPDGTTATVYWEAAAVLPAQRLQAYGYTAATAQDSLPGSNPYTAFFVTAATSNIDTFYDSPVDSGYSVDNLAPAPPAAFAARYLPSQVQLHWPANHEGDLAGYELYRGSSPSFPVDPAHLIHAANDTSYTDASNTLSSYKLFAIDVHGNRSAAVLVSPDSPTAAEIAFAAAALSETGVHVEWYVDHNVVPSADVQRLDGSTWVTLGSALPDGTGHITFDDANVQPGSAYTYRLAWSASNGTRTGGETSIVVPALTLAFHGAQPNPSSGLDAGLSFTLPTQGSASLALYDMAGRRVGSRDLSALGAGTHRVALREFRLPAGVYLVRVSQRQASVTGRIVIVR